MGWLSGEELSGILGFIEPGWLMGVELEILGGSDWPAKHTQNNVLISQQYKEQH